VSVCVGELVRRASTAATGPCCPGRHLFLPPPACECRCGERVRHAGAANVRGERMRRRAGAAASGCCMRVRRERVRRVRNSPSKAWNSFWHFSLQLPKHVVLPFLMSACVSKRTRRCMTPAQGGGSASLHWELGGRAGCSPLTTGAGRFIISWMKS